MELKMIIFDSEFEFRNYLILNSTRITKIVIFEDSLDDTLFFYGFIQEGCIIVAKEYLIYSFSVYRRIYIKLAKKFNLQIVPYCEQEKSIRIIR